MKRLKQEGKTEDDVRKILQDKHYKKSRLAQLIGVYRGNPLGGRPRGGLAKRTLRTHRQLARQSQFGGLSISGFAKSTLRRHRQLAGQSQLEGRPKGGLAKTTLKRQRQLAGQSAPASRPMTGTSKAAIRRRERLEGFSSRRNVRPRSSYRWVEDWMARGLCIPCGFCHTMTPRLHVVSQNPAGIQIDVCRRCMKAGIVDSKPALAAAPSEWKNLHYPERLLLARVQVSQLMFDLPSGGATGQYGRLYAVPLESPQLVSLFEDIDFAPVDGDIYVAWPGQSADKAVHVRAQPLYMALKWLHENNEHYAGPLIAACLRKWKEIRPTIDQPSKRLRGKTTSCASQASEQVPRSDEAQPEDDPWCASLTHFTSGGPAPVGADVTQLKQLRGLAQLGPRLDELMFPGLFPKGCGGFPGGRFSIYCRERLLGKDTRFQESPEYVFWLLETWLKKQVSAATHVFVSNDKSKVGGREQLLQKVYAVLRGVAGTQPYMYAKRAMALRMIAQLGPPTFFLTLTAHESQPQLLLACAFAHLRSINGEQRTTEYISNEAGKAVDVLMNKRAEWYGFTALGLCKKYPATVAREFMRMLREFIRWLAPNVDDEGDGSENVAKEDEVPTAVHGNVPDSTDLGHVLKEDCGQSLCGKCPCEGGCAAHQDFWKFQEERSGRSYRSWQCPGASADKKVASATLPPHRDPKVLDATFDKSKMKWGPKREHAGAYCANDNWEEPTEELPPFIVNDYVVRIEWQKRGMPHAHILLWCEHVNDQFRHDGQHLEMNSSAAHSWGEDNDAPTDDEAPQPQNIPEVYDAYVCTTAPSRWKAVYHNPMMADLAAKVRHNHTPYCGFRSTGVCRFGFPQRVAQKTQLKTTMEQVASRSKNNYLLRRRPGGEYMGLYNPVLLRRWRASMDLQLVRDGYAASKYILGYVLKNDTDKASQQRFDEYVKNQMDSTQATCQAVYKAAHVALQGRVTSVNEACHLVLGQPTVLFSRGNIWIPIGDPDTWSSKVDRKDERSVMRSAAQGSLAKSDNSMPAVLLAYSERAKEGSVTMPVEGSPTKCSVAYQDLTLFDFVAGVHNRGPKCRTPAVVGHKTIHPDNDPSGYFYAKLLMHVPWRNVGDWLQEADDGKHEKAFERILLEKPDFLKSLCFPRMQLGIEVARDMARLQCMLISLIGTDEGNAAQEKLEGHSRITATLRKLRDGQDANYLDAIDAARDDQHTGPVSDRLLADIPGGPEAIEELKLEGTSTIPGRLFRWFVQQVIAGDRPRIFIHGPGGCGKSHWVRAAVQALRDGEIAVAIGAPTGCAAFLINGATLHSLLALPVTNDSYGRACDAPPPTGALLQNLQDFWRPVRVLVIDEIGMISEQMFRQMDARLQLFCRRAGTPFGGLAVVMLGDLYQLPPPGGEPLYEAEMLWRHFSLVEFHGNHRASADPAFADLLTRARLGQLTDADVKLLNTRVSRRWSSDHIAKLHKAGAPTLLATRALVAKANDAALRAMSKVDSVPIYECPAEDTYSKTGHPSLPENSYDDPENTGGLAALFQVAIQARVMLRVNIDIADGLVNGSTGWVVKLVFHPETESMVVGIWVRFDHGGERWMSLNGYAAVLIEPRTAYFLGQVDGEKVKRLQFPLVLSWAKTIHKSQGATEPHGIMASLSGKQTGLSYVAISRCKRLSQLHLQPFQPKCFKASAGIERALAWLRQQQAHMAQTKDNAWRALFEPTESEQCQAATIIRGPGSAEQQLKQQRRQAVEAEDQGLQPTHICQICQEGFYTADALQLHQTNAHKNTMQLNASMPKRRITGKQPPASSASSQMPAKQAGFETSDAGRPSSSLRSRLRMKNVVPAAQPSEDPQQQDNGEDEEMPDPLAKAPLTRRTELNLFHEKQESGLCAMHALNNALGERWQTPADMEFALKEYMAEAHREDLDEKLVDHFAPGGWYSSEVLAFAVRATTLQHEGVMRYQLNLQPISEDPTLIHHCLGVVMNIPSGHGGHWVALRSIAGEIWRHDSLRRYPVRLSNTAYLAYLHENPAAYPIVPHAV